MPTGVFLLVPDLAPCGEAGAARVLSVRLPRDRFRVSVGVLGPVADPAAKELRAAGVAVHSVPVRHLLDVSGARRLRRVVAAEAPALLHTWGPTAARLSRLVVVRWGESGNTPRLVASAVAVPGSGLGGWLAARQVRRADRVIPTTWADGDRYRRFGVPGDRLTRIGPAALLPPGDVDRASVNQSLGVPAGSRLLVAGGQAEGHFGPRDAIVAFDMLRYEAPDLYLAVLGAGSSATALEQFGRALAFDDFRVRFGPEETRASAVPSADVVLVTRPRGGAEEALAGMAAGRPVVGWQSPDLAEVVDDGVTGVLVPLGDRAALAAKTRLLLDDPALAGRLGEAGRARATGRFGADQMVEQYARVYAELVAGS